MFALFKTILELAVAHELLVVSPLKEKLHRPAHVTSTEKEAYTVAQVQSIIEHTPAEHSLLFLVAMIVPVRVGELLAFRWCDLRDDVLSIEHSLWRGELQEPKTAASKRRVTIPPELVELLEGHRKGSDWNRDEDFIFARSDGRPHDPDLLREQVLYPAVRAAGIEIQKHQNGFHAFMNNQTSTDNKVIFANVRDLAKYLDVSERRLRQYKEAGRLNYTTDAVLVDRDELRVIKQAIAAWAAPYVPHRFRAMGNRNKKALSRFSRHGKCGDRHAELRSRESRSR